MVALIIGRFFVSLLDRYRHQRTTLSGLIQVLFFYAATNVTFIGDLTNTGAALELARLQVIGGPGNRLEVIKNTSFAYILSLQFFNYV